MPDVVLLDIMMPILSAASMLKSLREDPAHCNIPAVIMSSLPDSNISDSAEGTYAAFLRKPFRRKAVVNVVNAVLGRQS